MLTDDVLSYLDRSVLCWLATVDSDGMPNVSPKEAFAAYDAKTLLIANIASPKTIRNLTANPQVCVSFVDVFTQKGYKLKGTAKVVESSAPRYPILEKTLLKITQEIFPIRSIIVIEVTTVEPILAPSYRLFPGTTEASQVTAAMKTYGVGPETTS